MSRQGRHGIDRHGIDRHELELVSEPESGGESSPEQPEEYGLRVTWQSEAVRIEAAEFLVATRTEHEARIRAARNQDRLLHPEHT